jgi:hypothetical protein
VAKIHIPYFDPIDPFDIDEEKDYTGQLILRGKEVLLDINIEGSWISPDKLEAVKKIMGRLVSMDAENRQQLYNEYYGRTGTMVRYYLQYHLENIWRKALEKLIDFNNKEIAPIDQLFKCLHLVRVGFYPENEDTFAIFDYCIDVDYTEYVIVINFDLQGKMQEMIMEL